MDLLPDVKHAESWPPNMQNKKVTRSVGPLESLWRCGVDLDGKQIKVIAVHR